MSLFSVVVQKKRQTQFLIKSNASTLKLTFVRKIITSILVYAACTIFTSCKKEQSPIPAVIVNEANLKGWEKHIPAGSSGTINFVNGPAIQPLGNGSVQFYCPDKKLFRLKTDQFVGTLLSTITEFSYSTYIQKRDSTVDNVFIVLQIDINDDGIDDFPLVFNPVYQTGRFTQGVGPDQGATKMKEWQNWNLLNGGWWRGGALPVVDPDSGAPLFTLAAWINQYPKATIRNRASGVFGSFRFNGGSPVFAGPFIGYVDNFKIGINGVTTTFDFEY